MKKLFYFFPLLLCLAGFSQAVPSQIYRISDTNTLFEVNIPIGTLVYCESTNKLYVCRAATKGTTNLTISAANFAEKGAVVYTPPDKKIVFPSDKKTILYAVLIMALMFCIIFISPRKSDIK